MRCKFCSDEGKPRSFPTIAQWKDHCLVAHSDLEVLAASTVREPEDKEKDEMPPSPRASTPTTTAATRKMSSPTLKEKSRCVSCNMNFPSKQALRLHKEVCQDLDQEAPTQIRADEDSDVKEVEDFEEISIKEEMIIDSDLEPTKKKTKRPPPALIPLK